MWHHYEKGTRCGEWRTTEFTDRDAAVAWAIARGPGTVVFEIPSHHTLPRERVEVLANGGLKSERGTVIG